MLPIYIHPFLSTEYTLFQSFPEPNGNVKNHPHSNLYFRGDVERTVNGRSLGKFILRKLLWYRQSGEASERRWRDVLGAMRTRAKSLDDAYLLLGAKSEAR